MLTILDYATKLALSEAQQTAEAGRAAAVVTALVSQFTGTITQVIYDADDTLLATVTRSAWELDTTSATKTATLGDHVSTAFSAAGTPARVVFKSDSTEIFECSASLSGGGGDIIFYGAIADGVPVSGGTITFSAMNPVSGSNVSITIGGTATLPTTIVLSTDDTVVPTSAELVTFGVPVSVGVITDLSQVRVTIGGVEQPIAVAAGLMWHWLDNSYRSVTVQMVVDMTGGDVTVVVSNTGRNTANDRVMQPVMDGWTDSTYRDFEGTVLLKPRVLPLHDRTYLANCGLIPPFVPLDTSVPKDATSETYFWQQSFGVMDAYYPWNTTDGSADRTKIDWDSWLFDRASAIFKLSMQVQDYTKRRAYLRNAALSKRHYMHWVRSSQIEGSPQNTVVPYWWDLKRFSQTGTPTSPASYGTMMYQACQHLKLALALLGDDSQWTAAMLNQWAKDMREKSLGTAAHDYADRYETYIYPAVVLSLQSGITERLIGLPSTFHLAVWEITGDVAAKNSLDKRLAFIKDMQQTHRQYEIEKGWPVSSGVFRHSAGKHGNDAWAQYAGRALANMPAGAKTVRIRTYMSDHDMNLWIANRRLFSFLGKGQIRVLNGTKVSDEGYYAIWDMEFSTSYSSDLLAGTAFNHTDDTYNAPYCEADAGMFSPWMTVTIVEFLWQLYCLTGNADIPEILRRCGNGINEHGFFSIIANDNTTLVKDPPDLNENVGTPSSTGGYSTVSIYAANDITRRGVWNVGSFMWGHREVLHPLSLAYLFETDPTRKQRLKTRIDVLIQYQWEGTFNNAASVVPNPRRMVNWVHVYSPYTTWRWVEQEVA